MTTDEIIRMAREAGAVFPLSGSWHRFDLPELLAFANFVADAERTAMMKRSRTIIVQAEERGAIAEREACAKWLDFYDGPNCRRAEAIRARTKP